jgi:hypothetical protein
LGGLNVLKSAWLLAALGLAWGSTATAKDLAAHAPPDTALAVVIDDLNLGADWVDALATRLKGAPALEAAAQGLRDWQIEGIQPFGRVWGAGLALERGVGLFVTGDQQVRLVFGGDRGPALKSLGRIAKGLGLPIEARGATLRLDGLELNCKGTGWVVCQSTGLAGKADTPLTVPAGARVMVRIAGKAARELLELPPGSEATFTLGTSDDGGQIKAIIKAPQLAMIAPVMQAGETPTRGQGTVDARTTGVLKLGLDGPKLFAFAKQQTGGKYPPPVADLLTALEQHWSGDLWLSTAGGLSHPVLALGLLNGGGDVVLDALISTIQAQSGAKVTREGGTLRIVPPDQKGEQTRLTLETASTAEALVFTLGKADADRVRDGAVRPADLPTGFADKGRHGLLFWGLPALLFGGYLPPFVELPPKLTPLSHLQTMGVAAAGLVEVVGADLEHDGTQMVVSLWWRTL